MPWVDPHKLCGVESDLRRVQDDFNEHKYLLRQLQSVIFYNNTTINLFFFFYKDVKEKIDRIDNNLIQTINFQDKENMKTSLEKGYN